MAEQVLIGIGSNLEAPRKQVLFAMDAIATLPDTSIMARSSLYTSSPQGPQDQDDYVNAAVLVSTKLEPVELLLNLQRLEKDFGRVKTRHWGERIIDLDILFYGQHKVDNESPQLTIPHRESLSRDFVILPCLEIAPDWCLPNHEYLKQYADKCLNHDLRRIDS